MNRSFWRGDKVQLCAVEINDLEALTSPEEDTELDRYEDFIRFPSTKEIKEESDERTPAAEL